MRCKNCLRTTSQSVNSRANCWKKWQLCGQCAVKEHPEGFSESKIKSWTAIPITKKVPKISKSYAWNLKRKPRMHTHCLNCNGSLEDKNYNSKYCSSKCRLSIYETDKSRGEYFKSWYKNRRLKIIKTIQAKNCKLCGRNIHKVNPNKKYISYYCGEKCMKISNHMQGKDKTIEEIKVQIPLQTYIDLLRDGNLE